MSVPPCCLQVHVIHPVVEAGADEVAAAAPQNPWMFLLYRASHYDLIYPFEHEWLNILHVAAEPA